TSSNVGRGSRCGRRPDDGITGDTRRRVPAVSCRPPRVRCRLPGSCSSRGVRVTDTDRFDEALDRDWSRYASQLARRISELAGSDAFELHAETASGPAACVRVLASAGGHATIEVTGSEPVTRPVSEADMLARHIVSVLRGRGKVPHPAFLQAHPPSALGDLRERVSDALAHALGRPVPVDADGDFVVVLDSQVVFVVIDDDGSIRLWAPLLHAIPEDDTPGAAPA